MPFLEKIDLESDVVSGVFTKANDRVNYNVYLKVNAKSSTNDNRWVLLNPSEAKDLAAVLSAYADVASEANNE